MKFCPNCGAKVISEQAKFCMECGQSFLDMEKQVNELAVTETVLVNSNDNRNDDLNIFFESLNKKVKQKEINDKIILKQAEDKFLLYDLQEAERMLIPLAQNGYGRAQYLLGLIYEFGGNGIEADTNKAVEYTLAAGSPLDGDEDLLGLYIFRRFISGNPEIDLSGQTSAQMEVKKKIKDFNVDTDPFMKFEMAMYYMNENNDDRNMSVGEKNLKNTYKNNDLWISGLWLINIINPDKNKVEYAEIVENLAEKNIVPAISINAYIYYGNDFGKQNTETAKYWAELGAGLGDDDCIYLMGRISEEEGEIAKAIKWYEGNADKNINSAIQLSGILMNFDDNPQIKTDRKRAEKIAKNILSKDKNNRAALVMLGIYEALNKNFYRATNYLEKAKNNSNEDEVEEVNELLKTVEQLKNGVQQKKEGCFITTAVCGTLGKLDDCYELTMFRDFRDKWLIHQVGGENLINEYYDIAPKIVYRIDQLSNDEKIYREIWDNYLVECLNCLEHKRFLRCKEKYIEMMIDLKKKYFDV